MMNNPSTGFQGFPVGVLLEIFRCYNKPEQLSKGRTTSKTVQQAIDSYVLRLIAGSKPRLKDGSGQPITSTNDVGKILLSWAAGLYILDDKETENSIAFGLLDTIFITLNAEQAQKFSSLEEPRKAVSAVVGLIVQGSNISSYYTNPPEPDILGWKLRAYVRALVVARRLCYANGPNKDQPLPRETLSDEDALALWRDAKAYWKPAEQ